MKKKIIITMLSIGCLLMGFTTTAYAKEELEQITDMWWDEDGVANWEEVENSSKYEVKLYRGSTEVASAKTSKEKNNFSSKLDKSGTYRFRVRATGKGDYSTGAWSAYSESLELTSSDIADMKSARQSTSNTNTNSTVATGNGISGVNGGPGASALAATWVQSGELWWYRNADGSYPKSAWSLINGKWYFFDDAGYMKTGWITWNNQYYYCGADGAMLTGAQVIDQVSYTFDGSGVMAAQ